MVKYKVMICPVVGPTAGGSRTARLGSISLLLQMTRQTVSLTVYAHTIIIHQDMIQTRSRRPSFTTPFLVNAGMRGLELIKEAYFNTCGLFNLCVSTDFTGGPTSSQWSSFDFFFFFFFLFKCCFHRDHTDY